jgi:geranylgeranyl reductase family protein
VTPSRYDVLVAGAGPAGSVAALVLARGGARVALVDKATFPRDKACGDLIGPRGIQVLDDLGIEILGERVGDMDVVGPTGRHVRLRAFPGLTYPGFGLAVPRRQFDAALRLAAIDAGAEDVTGRADVPCFESDGELAGFRLEGPGPVEVRADAVIGADGALSRVAQVAGLVDEGRALWGFAMRAYVTAAPARPQILFWEPATWQGYPGYGWLFPGIDGMANVGLGIGVKGSRRGGARPAQDLGAFLEYLIGRGSLPPDGSDPAGRRLGGWLKMGMVGTTPARGRMLLVGDAAGLVNPLQGEGISQALASGRAAASAILSAGPDGAADRYRSELGSLFAPYASTTAPLVAAMLTRPKVVAGLSRLVTARGVGRLVSGTWSVYWNDLLVGARPGWPRRGAIMARVLAEAATRANADRRAVWASLDDRGVNPPRSTAPAGGVES